MPRRARQPLAAAAAMLCLLAAGCSGGEDSGAAPPPATTSVRTEPPLAAPASIPSARTKEELTRLLAEAGVEPGRVPADRQGTLAAVWRAFRAFAGIRIDDPFLSDTTEREGDGLAYAATEVDEAPYGPTFRISFVRRNKFDDFAGAFNRQQQVRVSVHLALTDALARAGQGWTWSYDDESPSLASQFAAWERIVEATPSFRRALRGARPIGVEIVREEGDIH